MQKKNGGTARIALLINSPLFAKLRDVLRERGTGSHAPDRQKNCSPPQRLLCANNGVGYCPFHRHVFDGKLREFGLQSLVRLPGGFFQHFSLLRCDLAVGDELVDLLFDKDSAAGGVGDIQNGPDRFVDFGDLFLGEVRASAHHRQTIASARTAVIFCFFVVMEKSFLLVKAP